MDPAAPSSSPSSPQLGRKRTTASTLEEPLTPKRHCSMDDVMRRAPVVDAPPPVSRAASTLEEPLTPQRYSSLDDVMRRAPAVDAPPPVARERVYTYYETLLCETCGSADREDDLILCDRCDRGHHTFCLRPIVSQVPIGPWFCPICAPPIQAPKSFPVNERKIFNFFGIQKDEQDAQAAEYARRRRKRSLVMHKKRRRILPFVPSEDGARRLKQLASLASALTTSKTEFCNELTYMPNMAPRSSNLARLEVGGIQVLHKEDKESLELCTTMQKRGEFPPLLVVYDSQEGFTVQADGNIKDMTFLAEYSGDVDYLENRANDDCDCLMTLLLSANPSQNLVICPDKWGNISRFFSGINNHTPDGKKKKNVKCVRYNIDGESHVLLVACRDIACGDKLYYDYNGFATQEIIMTEIDKFL
ncbi:unnamed protein product [Miscanthus lutarioriparius]|uniref:Histone-lysine N-methyltransferase ATXR5 n=1 Tax=Miscanthus lutarioriparius TaxID=422564 RepID=A0A811Q145_9POAL|nr:unnamed protein product [Miscanthus lutarioriparius]